MIAHEYQSIIDSEINYADSRFGPFHSTAEGLGVLLEEFNELSEAVHDNDTDAIVKEALQVAAVATRLALSLDNEDTRKRSGCREWRP